MHCAAQLWSDGKPPPFFRNRQPGVSSLVQVFQQRIDAYNQGYLLIIMHHLFQVKATATGNLWSEPQSFPHSDGRSRRPSHLNVLERRN